MNHTTQAPEGRFVPPGSVAAMMRALSPSTQPTAAFRDAACATLRLTRERGRIECEALAALFEDEHTSDDRRSLILDFLAHAGTPEAQAVMRRLLAGSVARRDGRTFVSFVQRLGFMERPDVATLRFLVSVYQEGKREAPEIRAACAYALGAGVGRAYVWGLTDAAMRAAEVLRGDLLSATTIAEKCCLVTALGNAAVESDVSTILRFASDPESRVRSAAVLALKKMHTAEARASLLTLLSTSDQSVAESALSALFEQTLGHDEIVRLAELVLAGRTPLALDGRILRLIVTQKLHVVGQVSLATVEHASNLLLSRIESQTARPASPTARPELSRYVRPLVSTSVEATRTHAIRKTTPLPYSASYSLVSKTESTHVAEMPPHQPTHVSRVMEITPVAPVAEVALQSTTAPIVPGRTRQTLSYGALSEAIRAAALEAVDNVDDGWDVQEQPRVPAPPPTTPSFSTPKLESDIRGLSVVSMPSPIVPLAIIR